MVKFKLMLTLACAIATLGINAQSNSIKFEEFDLNNGLYVVLHQDNTTPIINISVMYQNENPNLTGFAHFFEHLMFEGTNMITNPADITSSVYFDVTSGFKIKQVSTSPNGSSTTTFAKYEEIDGIKFPMIMTQTVGPQTIDIAVDAVELNKGIEDSVFNN